MGIITKNTTSGLIVKSENTGDNKPVYLTIQTGETTIVADEVIGEVNFQVPDEASGTDALLVAAGIAAVAEGTFAADANATKLSFKTAASEDAAEKMALSSTGTLKLKETSAAVADTAGMGQLWVKNSTPCELYFTTDAGSDIQLTSGANLAVTLGSDASGDMYYRDSGGDLTRIAVGSDNHVLTLDGAVPGWEAASGGGSNEFHIAIQGFTYSHTSNTYFRTLPGSAGGIGYWTTAEAGQTADATDTLTIDFQLAGPSGATFIAPAACTITELRGYIKTGSGADILTARLYKATGTDDETGTSDSLTATQMNAGAAISAATNGKCFTFSESISANNALSAGDSLLLGFSANGTSTQKNYFTITIRGAWS